MNTQNPLLSIVIPALNEEDNVIPLYQEIRKVCQEHHFSYEIIFVNDGSTDETSNRLKTLKPVKIINFRKRSGQTAAMDAGIKHSTGKIIITMDADRQNDPNDIPKLLNKLSEGYDVVSGWRKNRQDPFLKKFTSRGANLLRKILVDDGIQDSGCTLKAYKRECFEQVDLYGEMHRFIPAILKWRGFKIGEIVVNHRARTAGQTKYNLSRTLKGFVDMISLWFSRKYFNRPLHLFGGMGLVTIFLGILAGLGMIYDRWILGHDLSNTALTTLSIFLILFGTQLFISGLMIDLQIKNYHRIGKENPYLIKEIIEN